MDNWSEEDREWIHYNKKNKNLFIFNKSYQL